MLTPHLSLPLHLEAGGRMMAQERWGTCSWIIHEARGCIWALSLTLPHYRPPFGILDAAGLAPMLDAPEAPPVTRLWGPRVVSYMTIYTSTLSLSPSVSPASYEGHAQAPNKLGLTSLLFPPTLTYTLAFWKSCSAGAYKHPAHVAAPPLHCQRTVVLPQSTSPSRLRPPAPSLTSSTFDSRGPQWRRP